MKSYLVFIFLIYCCACSNNPAQKSESTQEGWITTDSTVQIHSYTLEGYLDSTSRTEYFLFNKDGVISMAMTSIIIREYDKNNNLISEKDFLIKNNKRILMNEIIREYDRNNNMIFEVDKSNNTINTLTRRTYNQNRLAKEIRIMKIYERYPGDEKWGVDSISAHFSKTRIPNYDTTIRLYSYNSNGDPISPSRHDLQEEYPETDTISKEEILYVNRYQKSDTVIIYEHRRNLYTKSLLSTDTTWEIANKEIKWVNYDFISKENRKKITRYDKKGNEVETVSYINKVLDQKITRKALQ